MAGIRGSFLFRDGAALGPPEHEEQKACFKLFRPRRATAGRPPIPPRGSTGLDQLSPGAGGLIASPSSYGRLC